MSKRVLVLLTALMLIGAACGSDAPSESAAETTTAAPEQTTAPEPEPEEPEAAEPEEAEPEEAEPEADEEPADEPAPEPVFPMTIAHDRGETTIDAPPENILVVGPAFAEMAMVLDVPMAGITGLAIPPGEDGSWPALAYVGKPVLGDPTFFEPRWPEQEALFGEDFDLILHSSPFDTVVGGEDENHDLYSEVAPTLTFSGVEEIGAWIEPFRAFAQVVGKSEQAEEILATYEAQMEALASAADEIDAETVTTMLGLPDTLLVLDGSASQGATLTAAGFEVVLPEGTEVGPDGFLPVSPEILGTVDADVLVMGRFGPGVPILGEELWPTIDVPIVEFIAMPGPEAGPIADPLFVQAIVDAMSAGLAG